MNKTSENIIQNKLIKKEKKGYSISKRHLGFRQHNVYTVLTNFYYLCIDLDPIDSLL